MEQIGRLKGKTPIERLKNVLDIPEMLDCTFIVGEEKQEVKASRLLLSCVSSVFEAMFFGQLSSNEPIVIPDAEPSVFKKFLQICLHTFDCSENSECELIEEREDAVNILHLADKYLVNDVLEICANYLQPKRDSEFFESIKIASLFSVTTLFNKCLEFLRGDAEVLNSKQFLELDSETVLRIFQEDYLKVYSELQMFYVAVSWATEQCKKRCLPTESVNLRKIMRESSILNHIRFLSMPLEEFKSVPYKSNILTEEESAAIISNIQKRNFCTTNNEDHCLPTTLSPISKFRWLKVWLDYLKLNVAEMFADCSHYVHGPSVNCKYLVTSPEIINIVGVMLNSRHSENVNDEYYENVTVFVTDLYRLQRGQGSYKGTVKFNTGVCISFSDTLWFTKSQIIVFKVTYTGTAVYKASSSPSPVDTGTFKLIDGENTITRIYYGTEISRSRRR